MKRNYEEKEKVSVSRIGSNRGREKVLKRQPTKQEEGTKEEMKFRKGVIGKNSRETGM